MPDYPIKLDGSEAASSPLAWNIVTRSGKASNLSATDYDNAMLVIRETLNDLNNRILNISSDHVFADTTERDNYFVANPSELVAQLYIIVNNQLQQYNDSAWEDRSIVVTGPQGDIGPDGPGLEYDWSGTELGVRVEGEATYVYTDLEGSQGIQGNSIEYNWVGTELGVKAENEAEYLYADLKGDQGNSIEYNWIGTELGVRVEGDVSYVYTDLQGETGPQGNNMQYNWSGTELGIKIEGDAEYIYVNLKGETGLKGDQGNSIEYNWIGTELGLRVEGDVSYTYTDLQGIQGEQGDPWNQWQGDWTAGTYQALDAVAHNGSSWIANTTTSQEPSGSATDWDIIAQKGTDGAGTGDVIGPASSVSGNFASFSSATGKAIQDSGAKAADFEAAGAAAAIQGNLDTHAGNTTDAHGINSKVEKATGYSLVADTEIAKIHAAGSDDQDLSGLVEKETGKSLVLDTEIAKIHAAGSDDQDLSGLVEKATGYSLVADTEIAKIHEAGSDNQDLSHLVEKEAGKSLVLDTEIAKIHTAGSDDQDLSHLVEKVADYSLMPDSHLTSHPAPTDRDTRNDPAGAASGVQDNLTTHENNTTDAHGINTKVDKVIGSSLVADTEIAKIHAAGSDDQDLSGLVEKETGKSLVLDTEIAKIHDQSHGLGSTDHTAATLSELNNKISDATLIDTDDARLSDARTPTTHGNDKHSTNYEAELGNPTTDGQVLSSTISGTRSWIDVETEEPLTISDTEPTTPTPFWYDSFTQNLFVYNSVSGLYVPSMLTIDGDKDNAYQVLMGLTSSDGPWLESWLDIPANLTSYNLVLLDSLMVDDIVITAGTMGAIINSEIAINNLVGSSSAMPDVAASATAMNLIAASITAMDTVVNSQIAMENITSTSVARNSVLASLTGRTLLFTSSYALSTIWSTFTAVDAIAQYFDSYCTKTGSGDLGILQIPIDCSLISGASIYARSSSTLGDYDTKQVGFLYDGSTSGTLFVNDTDEASWNLYNNSTADNELELYGTSAGILEIKGDMNYSYNETVVVEFVSTTADERPLGDGVDKPVFSLSHNGSSSPHYFWGLQFTRQT